MSQLSSTLDKIWKSRSDRISEASRQSREMSDQGLIELLFCLVYSVESGRIDVELERSIPALRLALKGSAIVTLATLSEEKSPSSLIELTDISRTLSADDSDFGKIWGPSMRTSVGSLLAATQFSRDHLDTLLFYPQDRRDRAIESEAESMGVDQAVLRAIGSNIHKALEILEPANA